MKRASLESQNTSGTDTELGHRSSQAKHDGLIGNKGKSLKATEEFDMKPITLAKRQDKDKDKAGSKEFHCRPMQLGARNKTPMVSNEENIPMSSPESQRRRSIQIRNLPIVEPSFASEPNSAINDMVFAVCIVDFHHVRGPEIQWWKSNYCPTYPSDNKLFKNLPFQALPDGSHLFQETFSNFNLVYDFHTGWSYDDGEDYSHFDQDPRHLKTLFGCSCVRQVKTSKLSGEEISRNKDITRSIVQKAIVVVARHQPIFQIIKEKLSIISASYFMQQNFGNVELLESLFNDLNANFKVGDDSVVIENTLDGGKHPSTMFLERQEEFFVNLNLKQNVLRFKNGFLSILKALMLEKRVLIYSNNNLEMLTQFQNNLISLIPNLINNLDNSGCPLSDYSETNGPLSKPNSLNTNDRQSMLRFFGLPLQLFNTKGTFWNPYLPLQQLSELSSPETKGFMVGCSNLLFVNQVDSLSIDVLVNLDSYKISYPKGKAESLSLTSRDKNFISTLLQNIKDNESVGGGGEVEHENFTGSDDYIRYQFEDYIVSLLSTTRYHQYYEKFNQPPPGFSNVSQQLMDNSNNKKGDTNASSGDFENDVNLNSIENGNLNLFGKAFTDEWFKTKNYRIWNAMADEFIFNFLDPKHIAVDFSDSRDKNYNFGDIFNNLKSRLNNSAMDTNPESSYNSHKFIADDNSIHNDKQTSNETASQTTNETTNEANKQTNKQPNKQNESTGGGPRQEQLVNNHTNANALSKRISSWTSAWSSRKK